MIPTFQNISHKLSILLPGSPVIIELLYSLSLFQTYFIYSATDLYDFLRCQKVWQRSFNGNAADILTHLHNLWFCYLTEGVALPARYMAFHLWFSSLYLLKFWLRMNHPQRLYNSLLFVISSSANPCKFLICRWFTFPYAFPCVISSHNTLRIPVRKKTRERLWNNTI